MMLEIINENFKKAVRENIEKVIERDIKQDIHNIVSVIADKLTAPTEEKLIKAIDKRINHLEWGARDLVRNEIIIAINNNVDKFFTILKFEEVIEKKVDKYLQIYLTTAIKKVFEHDKKLEEIIRQQIDQKVAVIFAEKFFKSNQ